jgi:hypothetical protein
MLTPSRNCVVASIVLFLLAFPADGQQQPLDILLGTFDDFRKHNFQEKIFVHTDREFYITGETLWFRIFNVDAIRHLPANISKVAYVDILDERNLSVLQAKIALKEGGGSGSFYVAASLTSGNYTLRAYTQWMKNFSPDLYFTKNISIVNPFVKPEPARQQPVEPVSLDFFPEGGHLVTGLESVVAFKAADGAGSGIQCRGQIFTDQGDTVTRFASEKFGIGRFSFTPRQGVKYRARLVDTKQNISFHGLPEAKPHGYVMTVKDSSEKYLEVRVQYSMEKTGLNYLYLLAHTRQVVAHAQALPVFNNAIVFQIEKSRLGEGISHITLFDGDLQPVCERLWFRQPRKMEIGVETDQKQYGVRRRVRTAITASGTGTMANLSVSVFRIDSLSSNETENILNYLWLSSDLKGKVESPAYYFSDDVSRLTAIDNLMLTHGWRRFNWDQVLKKPNIDFVPEYRGHIIHARVTDRKGQPAPGVMTYLASPGKVTNVYASVSNKKGFVKFEAPDFYGSTEIILQTASDSVFNVEIQDPFSSATTRAPEPLVLEKRLQAPLVDRTIGMQVQDIYNEYTRKGVNKTQIDSVAFYGRPDEMYYLDDYTRFPVMEEVMREYVPGVLVRKRRDGFHFLVLDVVNKTVMQDDPLILLDGVPVRKADDIMKFDPRKIRKLEVVTRPYFLGPATFKGIVSYSTYGGDLAGFEIDPAAVRVDYEGLQLQREFYSPRYENENQRTERIPDQRSVLYWDPQVKTTGDEKTRFDFFTSDLEGTFMIRVEGLSNTGEAAGTTSVFTVKRLAN